MREPEEQEDFLTRGRFEDHVADDRRLTGRVTVALALAYWVFVAGAFLINFFVAFLATLPWSYLVMSLQMQLARTNSFVDFLNSKGGGFLIFPGVCGGLNVFILVMLIKLLTGNSNKRQSR